jgi:hypothetical protein
MRNLRPLIFSVVAISAFAAAAGSATAALQGDDSTGAGQIIVGRDNDSTLDPTIQPPGVAADQSLRKGDQLRGGRGNDVLVGRLGPDTLTGGDGDDVLVGGTERGSDAAAFPNFDIAYGGAGDDAFIWTPGDGSDAFVGGKSYRTKVTFKKQIVIENGRRFVIQKKVEKKLAANVDTLIIGTMALRGGDNSQPQLLNSPFGLLPRVNVSDRGLPATIGDSPAQAPIKGFCQIVPAPVGLGYQYLVRFFGDAGAQAVTIRVKDVEQVLCGNRNADGITQTTLGREGKGPIAVASTNFVPAVGSRLDALVD